MDIISISIYEGDNIMPRHRRIKEPTFIYHIMCKSISDTLLFRDDRDKEKFLSFVQHSQRTHGFKVYAYCLMDNHVHLMIDANGADVSKFMHEINQLYAQYFNRKYHREGHLFKDRFKSKVVDSQEYLFTLSAYIHNNSTDIKGYKHCPEKYPYSTLGMYLGIAGDPYGIVDKSFVLGFFSGNVKRARENYYKFVKICDDDYMKDHFDFKDEKSEYRSERTVLVRSFNPEDIMEFITGYIHTDKVMLKWKYNRKATECRALCVLLMRYYCDFTYKQICEVMGRLTLSRVSALVRVGHMLVYTDERYKNIMQDFIEYKKA